jgi:hypothetical protein
MSTNYKCLQIYKGNCFNKQYIRKYTRVLVFDFDETLGSFSDLYTLWVGTNTFRNNNHNNEINQQNEFNQILDLYPEFLRYGILNILEYLYLKKKRGYCDKVFIYTNNNCNYKPPWVSFITNYFKYKLNFKEDLFDKIIYAFKINNKIIELSRTTRDKTYNDFINCTLLPTTTEICFIDNTYYSNMVNEKVYYIHPRSYFHNISTNTIIERFINSNIGIQIQNDLLNEERHGFTEFLYDWFEINNRCSNIKYANIETDIFVAQKLMYHIKEFFYLTQRKNRTRKKHFRLGRITRKNIT